jgi:hypothetical protein
VKNLGKTIRLYLVEGIPSRVITAEINGRKYWKVKDSNQTYGDWQESQISKIENE